MSIKSISQCEREERQLKRMLNFQFPKKMKLIGFFIAGAGAVLFLLNKFIPIEKETIKLISSIIFTSGLFLVTLSRDKDEDELIKSIRGQSYALAFMIGIIYLLIMPWVHYGADLVFNGAEKAVYEAISGFHVIMIMLTYHVMFFNYFKKLR
ncbi:MAG: hypothetical protein ACI81S_001767 [Sphingobacteriales bacterium]|jgi:hypothetical protein